METIFIVILFSLLSICCFIKSFDFIQVLRKTNIDHLSGMYNRKILAKLHKEDGAIQYSIISVDIDHFKNINDTFGHHTGDVVIKTVSQIIISEFKAKVDYCVRMGGEEFNIYLPSAKLTKDTLLEKAEKLRSKIEKTIIVENGTVIGITASIGCLFYDQKSNIIEREKMADKALYKAKQSGRNKVVFDV